MSLSYSRASIYDGLPGSLTDVMHEVMDNRLSSSSWRTVSAGVAIWSTVCAAYGWERVLRTDDPLRGGKLAAFVLHMTTKTTLVYGSIENYVWGVRVWMQSQMVVDPIMGVLFWPNFMQAIKVLTWVPGEPRRAVPHAVVEAIIDMVEARYLHDFFAVQMVFLILVLYYSFSRTECPCPKSYSGRECYDKDDHWNVCDFDIRVTAGVRAMWCRFRSSKTLGRSGRRRGRARGTGRASATCPIPSGRSSSGTRGCSSCTAWLATLARRCSWTRIRRGRCCIAWRASASSICRRRWAWPRASTPGCTACGSRATTGRRRGSVPTWRRRTAAGPRARSSATLDSHSLTSFASPR